MKPALISLALFSVIFTSGASAEGLKITPGMWETTMTSTNSMTGTTTRKTTNCMVEDEFDPQSMLEGAEGCSLEQSDLDGNTLTFSMVCNMQGADATMTGVYTVDGDEGEGSMNIDMSFSGQTMSMENVFTAKRIGDC